MRCDTTTLMILFALAAASAWHGAQAPATQHRACVRMLLQKYDVAIVGGGPVGVTAALRANALGRKAILIDATPPRQFQFTGPTGLFSKALRDDSQRIDVRVLREMGMGDIAVWAQVHELTSSILRKAGENNAAALNYARVPHLLEL